MRIHFYGALTIGADGGGGGGGGERKVIVTNTPDDEMLSHGTKIFVAWLFWSPFGVAHLG